MIKIKVMAANESRKLLTICCQRGPWQQTRDPRRWLEALQIERKQHNKLAPVSQDIDYAGKSQHTASVVFRVDVQSLVVTWAVACPSRNVVRELSGEKLTSEFAFIRHKRHSNSKWQVRSGSQSALTQCRTCQTLLYLSHMVQNSGAKPQHTKPQHTAPCVWTVEATPH